MTGYKNSGQSPNPDTAQEEKRQTGISTAKTKAAETGADGVIIEQQRRSDGVVHNDVVVAGDVAAAGIRPNSGDKEEEDVIADDNDDDGNEDEDEEGDEEDEEEDEEEAGQETRVGSNKPASNPSLPTAPPNTDSKQMNGNLANNQSSSADSPAATGERAQSPRSARRLRNRLAAARMRTRQKQHLEELEKRKEQLEKKAAELENELRMIQRKNNPLNSSIDKLAEMIDDLTKVEFTMLSGIDECKGLLQNLEKIYHGQGGSNSAMDV